MNEEPFRNEIYVSSPTSVSIGNNTWFAMDSKLVERIGTLIKENKQLKERVAYLERSNNRREDEIMSLRDELISTPTQEELLQQLDKCKSDNDLLRKTLYCWMELKEYTNKALDRYKDIDDFAEYPNFRRYNPVRSTIERFKSKMEELEARENGICD